MREDPGEDARSSPRDGGGVGPDRSRRGRPAAGSSGAEEEEEEEARGRCELCGGPTLERHCKIVCLRCGYTRDCSDP